MSKTTFSIHYSETLSMNHILHQPAPIFPMHTHDIEEIMLFRKGNGFYHEDGKTYPLRRNSLIISRATKNHGFTFEGDCDYERYDTLFDSGKLTSDIYNQIPSDISVVHFDDNAIVIDLFKKMDYYYKHFSGITLENLILHLIEEILYNVVIFLNQPQSSNTTYSINPIIDKAVTYIEEHITEPLSIESLCKELFITKAYLHQIFLKHLQISPKKYIISRKLLLAQKELRADKKATEVYLTCGFSDYSTFYRDYKKFFGHSPSEENDTKIVHRIQS